MAQIVSMYGTDVIDTERFAVEIKRGPLWEAGFTLRGPGWSMKFRAVEVTTSPGVEPPDVARGLWDFFGVLAFSPATAPMTAIADWLDANAHGKTPLKFDVDEQDALDEAAFVLRQFASRQGS
jgi:hypothetical protein